MIVSDALPPPMSYGVCYWERSPDPFHADAFKGLNLPPITEVIVLGGELRPVTTKSRGWGWLAIDWCENPVGFVPDGTVIDQKPAQEFTIVPGPHGGLVAYPGDLSTLSEINLNTLNIEQSQEPSHD